MKNVVHASLIGLAVFIWLAHSRALAQSTSTVSTATFGIPTAASTLPSATPSRECLVKPFDGLVSPARDADSRRVPLSVFWDDGVRFESANDQFHLHIGGTIQVDSTWLIGPSSVFALPSGAPNGIGNSAATFLRRARLRADGDIFGLFDFVIEYDFANASNENSGDTPPSFSNLSSSPAPTNVWIQIRDVPLVGYVRIGNQTKPIGMANNTSQANLPFLERPDVNDAIYAPFDGGFALGISARNWTESERLAWTIGFYRPSTNVFGVTLNKYAYGARVTGTPLYEDDGWSLIHLGLGFWGGQVVDDELRLRARPVLRNGPGFAVPVLVDTGQIPGTRQYTIGPEFALVQGALTFQAEWVCQFLTNAEANGQPQGTVFWQGGYIEALCFLTGEYQSYNKRDGVFGGIVPLNPYNVRNGNPCGSLGAWQIGARFSYVNLNDKAIQGGVVYDWTFGLNWYLNASTKFQFNYIVEHRDGPTGTPVGWINGVGVRAGLDF